jgi:hypothetical protein
LPLASNFTFALDAGFEWVGKITDKKGDQIGIYDGGIRLGFGSWVQKSWGRCSVKGGLAYRLADNMNGLKEAAVFSIPIMFNYTFL